jgi:hypothetical protein
MARCQNTTLHAASKLNSQYLPPPAGSNPRRSSSLHDEVWRVSSASMATTTASSIKNNQDIEMAN